MSHLYLLRHAKAARAVPGMADFDRPLEQRGVSDARAVGERMKEAGYRPDLVLCSPAQRTQETWACVERFLAPVLHGVRCPRQLYGSDARHYLDAIRNAGPAEALLVVGHNPMIEEIATMLVGAGRSGPMASGFPTAALAVIRFGGPLSSAGAGRGALEAFLTGDG
jgi:phosphohistidine phosphatase